MTIVAWGAFALFVVWMACTWKPGPKEDPRRKSQANWISVIGLILIVLGQLGNYLAAHHETLTYLLGHLGSTR